jgi:replicative DNA helicase
VSQLNRGTESRGDHRPVLSDLRESGQIEQDADAVVFAHREAYYDRENPALQGLAELIVAKQRNGPTGKVDVAFIERCTRFANLTATERERVERMRAEQGPKRSAKSRWEAKP